MTREERMEEHDEAASYMHDKMEEAEKLAELWQKAYNEQAELWRRLNEMTDKEYEQIS